MVLAQRRYHAAAASTALNQAVGFGVFGLVGLSNDIVSGLEKFEAPDPAYWCAQSYAICNPDIRGVINSDRDSVLWDR
jgi:hypothetical protein